MPKFEFTAVNREGKTIKSSLESTDRMSAISTLSSQNLKLINLEAVDEDKKNNQVINFKKGVKSDTVVMFTRQLSAMISAGVPILRSLTSMAQYTDSKVFKAAINDISKRIESGESFGEALSSHPNIFDDVYVNMVKAGESAGILDDILKRLALQQEKNATIRKKVKGSMAYPIVLVCITIVAFFGLMIFVIPSIGDTIKDLGGEDAELPALTKAMMGISDFLIAYWYIIFPIMGISIWAFLRYIKTTNGKRKFHYFLVKAPIISPLIKKISIARFTRTYSALVSAGVAVLDALDITAKAIGNKAYEDSLGSIGKRVQNGEVLSKLIGEDEFLYPPIVGQMLAVGEETGQTELVLVKVADFYEEEVDTAISSLSSIIEPVMIVLMGTMVGLIAASVMLPITGLANQIKA